MKYILFLALILTQTFSNSNLININFNNLKIMELIRITSSELNKNIFVSSDIKGKVNFMSNEPIKKESLINILKFSLDEVGYQLVKNGDILRVVKKDNTIKNEKVIDKNEEKKVEVKQIVSSSKVASDQIISNNFTEVVYLMNIDAKSLENILNKIILRRYYKNNLKPTVTVELESNSIILDGQEDDIKNIQLIISKLDIPKSQVYVKARIIELDDTLVNDIGMRFGIFGGKVYSGGIYTFSSSLNAGNAIAIDTSSIGLNIPNVSSSLALGASLSLLNKTYALDIISEPSILCLNNQESSIYVGETVSIQTGSATTDGGTTTNSFKREDIGLTLKVKPRVSKDNKVMLSINTIIEGIKNTNSLSLNPDTSKKEIKTVAIVNNGESVILGGLIENRNEKTVEKIPFASDVPLIGELFKNRQNNSKNSNLVVIVTPYIIPADKDLTYVRDEISKLKSLEDNFLKNVLLKLKEKQSKKSNKKDVKQELSKEQLHKARLKEYLGI